MALGNTSKTLTSAVTDWQQRGLLDQTTADHLRTDIAKQKSGFSFQSILVLLAIISLGFGAITFVAANWEEISRLTRVGIVFGAMWAAWASAAVAQLKSRQVMAQILVLLACILFGAGIMLISQIYHIQGEPKDAVWLWAVGTLLGAALTRSTPALAFAVILFTIWTYLEATIFSSRFSTDYSYLGYLAVCATLARWMRSRYTGHLILLSLAGWIIVNAVGQFDRQSTDFLIAAIFLSYALMAANLYSGGGTKFLAGFEMPITGYLVFTIGALLVFWYIVAADDYTARYSHIFSQPAMLPAIAFLLTAPLALLAYRTKNDNAYDIAITAVAIAITGILQSLPGAVPFVFEAFLLSMTIWIIRMGWRLEYRPIATLGFAGFAVIMLIIYFTTIGSLIGTSAFYLGIGILLLAGVFLVPKLMRKKGEPS